MSAKYQTRIAQQHVAREGESGYHRPQRVLKCLHDRQVVMFFKGALIGIDIQSQGVRPSTLPINDESEVPQPVYLHIHDLITIT